MHQGIKSFKCKTALCCFVPWFKMPKIELGTPSEKWWSFNIRIILIRMKLFDRLISYTICTLIHVMPPQFSVWLRSSNGLDLLLMQSDLADQKFLTTV